MQRLLYRGEAQHGMSPQKSNEAKALAHQVADSLDAYLKALNGHAPNDLYDMVLSQVEPPLLRAVLRYCEGNQSRAAAVLGLNRATLRKKLRHHGIRAENP
jgi:Fis family transcriptional regulator, factor for inversion stimulation protein